MQRKREQLRRGILGSAAMSIAGIVVVTLVFHSDLSRRSLQQVDPWFLLLAAGAMVGAWCVRALRTQLLVSAMGVRIPLLRLLRFFLASAFVSHVTPGSSGGLPVTAYLLHREGLSWGHSTAYTVLDSILTTAFLLVLTPVLLILWRRTLTLEGEFTLVVNLLLGAGVAAAAGLAFVVLRPRYTARLVARLTRLPLVVRMVGQRRASAARRRLVRELSLFAETFRNLLARQRSRLAWAGFHTFVYWGLYLAVAPLILFGLGVPISGVTALLAQLLFNLLQPFIPTPGGSGGAELSAAYLFKFFVPGPKLGVFVVLWRAVTFHMSLVLGALAFFRVVQRETDSMLGMDRRAD